MNLECLKEIEHLRKKMVLVALEKGFTSYESVALSQELDKLLNSYEGKSLSMEAKS